MRVVAGVACLLAVVGFSTAARVAGRIVILEKDNKPSPDLSDAVLYLESASFVTGEVLHVDGGAAAGVG